MDRILAAKQLFMIAKKLLASRPVLKKTQKHQNRVGEVTDFYYECEDGSFVVSYEPYGSADHYKMIYVTHNFKSNYPLDNAQKMEFNLSIKQKFEKRDQAVKYAENLLREVVQEAKKSDKGLAESVKNKPGYWWD